MELEHTLRILGLVVGAAALSGRALVGSADGQGSRYTERGQELASRALTLLSRTFGDRLLSLQFFSSSLMLALCAVSALYLKTLLDVGAGAALFLKYAIVLTAALTGLLVTFARGRWAGLLTFTLCLLALSALARTRARTYSTLFVLASPGMLAAFLSLPATRWCLRRARASRRAVAWLAGLAAAPAACFAAYDLAVSLVQPADPRLSAFFSALGAAAVLSCNTLLSVGLVVSVLGLCIHGVVRRLTAGGRDEQPDHAIVRRRMACVALLSIAGAVAPSARDYLELLWRGP